MQHPFSALAPEYATLLAAMRLDPSREHELAARAAAVLALVLNNSGYYGEIFRAGIEAVPRGQREAALSLGLRPVYSVFLIVLPQAIRIVIAPLATNSLELIKTTSIASLVALPELLRSARVAQEQTYNPTPLMAAAVIFFVLLWPLARLVARLERKMLASSQAHLLQARGAR